MTAALKAEVLSRLSVGELMVRICEAPHMVGMSTVHRELEADEQFREGYARARERGAEAMVERGLQHADAGEDVARDRLRWDALRWAAGKFNQKRFGDKVQAEVDARVEFVVTRQYAQKGEDG